MSDTGIFKVAVKLSAEQRAAYLDHACGADPELRREVESLLHAHGESHRFLERPALRSEPPDRLGTIIGPYKLLEQIGEGGMGIVYLAEQTHPIERRVALKIIKPGLDSRQILGRFEAERHALALMDHPNIAKVLDAGTVEPNPPTPFPKREGGENDSGSPSPLWGGGWGERCVRPYFVMELVKGVPIR
jgi:eukaryotic-like serine/threonine-protein kinase